jgi:hypothetical protein
MAQNRVQIGGNGPKTLNKSLNSCHIHQNWVFAVVIFGLYDPKTGSKLGLSGPKWFHKLGCNTLKPKAGSNLGYGPQNGVRNGLLTDLWTAFGYTGFWVYGLFGSGAFGYRGFWVYGLFGSHPTLGPQIDRFPYHGTILLPQNSHKFPDKKTSLLRRQKTV